MAAVTDLAGFLPGLAGLCEKRQEKSKSLHSGNLKARPRQGEPQSQDWHTNFSDSPGPRGLDADV